MTRSDSEIMAEANKLINSMYFKQLISEEQQALLRLRAIKDSNVDTQKEGQRIWSQLAQDLERQDLRVTKPLIKLLKIEFDRLGWGVKCLGKNCNEPATLLWLDQSGCAEGGALSFSHVTNGKRKIHCGRTTLPLDIEIISKLDRRKIKKRRVPRT